MLKAELRVSMFFHLLPVSFTIWPLTILPPFFTGQVAHGAAAEVILRARHPLHASQVEVMQVREVRIGFVEDDDLAFLLPGTALTGTLVVMLGVNADGGSVELQMRDQPRLKLLAMHMRISK